MASADRESLFEELVGLMESTSSDPFPRSDALACVMERELLMSTAIKGGVAIPHGKTASLHEMVGAIGVSRAGIEYDSTEGQVVRLAFMIISPTKKPEVHLRALKRLASFIEEPGFVEAMIESASPQAAAAVIARYEERLDSK